MFYHLFKYLESHFDIPGAGMFRYISFRSALAAITALAIGLFIGKYIIGYLKRKQIGETVRELGLEGQNKKQGVPTMGGIIIIISLLVPVLCFCDLTNVYVQLMVVTTIWLGFLGGLDDYIKVFLKDKAGLQGKFKVLGQVSLGIIIGVTFILSHDIVVRQPSNIRSAQIVETVMDNGHMVQEVKSTVTNIPFVKDNKLDYRKLVSFLGDSADKWVWVVMIAVFIFIITAVSNGANMTDGLDGLAAGTSSIIGATLGILAYVSGNMIYANYLNIMYIPYTGELVVFISAFTGAIVGFLWYNTYPAQVFMGDTGSLTLGGIIAVFAILIRKELLIPILCGVFLVENISVMIQVAWFKHTKRKYGEGRRIFLMAPLHHHYQKMGYPEAKIVVRFWIVSIILSVVTLATLKIR